LVDYLTILHDKFAYKKAQFKRKVTVFRKLNKKQTFLGIFSKWHFFKRIPTFVGKFFLLIFDMNFFCSKSTWQRSAIISHSLRSSPEPPRPSPSGQSFSNSCVLGAGQGLQAVSSPPPRPQARPFVQQQDRRLMLSARGAKQKRLLQLKIQLL
jgi:hypothetical protein